MQMFPARFVPFNEMSSFFTSFCIFSKTFLPPFLDTFWDTSTADVSRYIYGFQSDFFTLYLTCLYFFFYTFWDTFVASIPCNICGFQSNSFFTSSHSLHIEDAKSASISAALSSGWLFSPVLAIQTTSQVAKGKTFRRKWIVGDFFTALPIQTTSQSQVAKGKTFRSNLSWPTIRGWLFPPCY